MTEGRQVSPPSIVVNSSCSPERAGNATPWDMVVIPMKLNPPGGGLAIPDRFQRRPAAE